MYKESHYFNFFVSENNNFTAGFSLVYRRKEILRKALSCFDFTQKAVLIEVPGLTLRIPCLYHLLQLLFYLPSIPPLCPSTFPIVIPSPGPSLCLYMSCNHSNVK